MSLVKRHRASAVVVNDRKLLGFWAQDPGSQKIYFILPGGKIETHETAEQTAIRETLEETGYSIKVLSLPRVTKQYPFCWNNTLHDCTTEFVWGELIHTQAQAVEDADYHRGVHWLPLNEVLTLLAYDAHILSAVTELLVAQGFDLRGPA